MDLYQILLIALLVMTGACWIGLIYQKRQILTYRESAERTMREKEAVIELMDSIGVGLTRKIDLNETLEVIADELQGRAEVRAKQLMTGLRIGIATCLLITAGSLLLSVYLRLAVISQPWVGG